MPENNIVALLGLIASAGICYGIPQNYYTSNTKPESVSFACDPAESSGISSRWYVIPGGQESLMKRDYRDLEAVQPNKWSNSQNKDYRSQIEQSVTPQSSDFYPIPPETCRATRESTGNSPYIVQAPISGTDEAKKIGSTVTQNQVKTDEPKTNIPSFPSLPITPSSPLTPSSPTAPSSPIVYRSYQPKNPRSPTTIFQTSPYISYPGTYYYPTAMMQSYNPYQEIATTPPYAVEEQDEADYTDETQFPHKTYYVLFRADHTPSGIKHEQIYPISNGKIEYPVTEEELQDIIKRAIKVAKQQKKQQKILYEKRDSEDEMQKKVRKVHEKREHLNSGLSPLGVTLAPKIEYNPFNLPPDMNLKDEIEEAVMRAEFLEPTIMGRNNENKKSVYDDAEEEEESDLWGINRWEARKQMGEKRDTTFNGGFEKENEEKLADQQFTEDILKEEKLKGKKTETSTGINVAKKEEFERFKKEASKHLEAEDMQKEKSEEIDEKAEENKGKHRQIMRIEKTNTQIEKSDSIFPVTNAPFTSTETLTTTVV